MTRAAWAALLLALLSASARADGVILPGVKKGAAVVKPVRTPDQRALLSFDEKAGTETLVIETTLQGEGTEFAWILPLPAAPKIEASTTGLFPTLEVHCAAALHEDTTPWWAFVLGFGALWAAAIRWPHFRPPLAALGCLGVASGFSLLVAGMSCSVGYGDGLTMGGPDGATSVRVLSRETVGAYDTAVLATEDAEDLRRWLDENGFHAPPEIDSVVTAYVREGWVFAASKVRAEATSGEVRRIHPLAFTFPADEAVYPMRLTGALNESLALDLFVFARYRAGADDLDRVFCESRARGVPSAAGYFHPEVDRLAGESLALTRLTGTLDGDAMHRDVRFRWDGFEPLRPDVYTAGAANNLAATAAAFALAAALVLGARQARRRPAPGGAGVRSRLRRTVVAVGAVCVAVFVLVRISLPVLPEGSRRLGTSRQPAVVVFPWDTAAEIQERIARRGVPLGPEDRRMADAVAARPIFTDVAAARAWMAPLAARVVNPVTGESTREEDSPGNYELEASAGTVRLWVREIWGRGGWTDLGSFRTAGPDVPRVVVEGRVRDTRGAPLPGATVRIAVAAPGPGRPPDDDLAEGVTADAGPDGAFSVEVPSGFVCDVAVDWPEGAFLLVEDVDLRSAPAAPLELVVPDGLTLRGRVVESGGPPSPVAVVRFRRPERFSFRRRTEAPVAADGTFEIRGIAPGTLSLDVEIHGDCREGRCPRAEFRLVPGAAPIDLVIDRP